MLFDLFFPIRMLVARLVGQEEGPNLEREIQLKPVLNSALLLHENFEEVWKEMSPCLPSGRVDCKWFTGQVALKCHSRWLVCLHGKALTDASFQPLGCHRGLNVVLMVRNSWNVFLMQLWLSCITNSTVYTPRCIGTLLQIRVPTTCFNSHQGPATCCLNRIEGGWGAKAVWSDGSDLFRF